MKRCIICFLLLMCIAVNFTGCGSKKLNQDTPNKENDSKKMDFYTTDEDCFAIETQYGILEYPKKWKEKIKTEIVEADPYTVKFICITSARDIPLFDLNYGGGEGFLLGTIPKDSKKIPVYLNSFAIDKTTMSEEEYSTCRAMSEDVNVIISRLIEKNGMILSGNNQTPELSEDNNEVFSIKTKYGNLFYPKKWKELVKIEIVDKPIYTVKFSTKTSTEELKLFDLTFNGGDGYHLGSMNFDGNDVTISINDYTLSKDKLNEEEYYNCCAMQENVNVILEHLVKDYGFTFS